MTSTEAAPKRPTLGDFMDSTCFQYLRSGTEDLVGRAAIVLSGKNRGSDLINELGLAGSTTDASVLQAKLDEALGINGTRLCMVQNVVTHPNGGYEVRIAEGACTAGVSSDMPHCAFTLGVFVGAISALTGKTMIGRETECSAQGKDQCIYEIEPM